jgi:tol-pal system protein YbgF
MRALIPALALALTTGCVLDRTGQSASEVYRRELALQGARVTNLETQFDALDGRVAQMEELNRARGQQEILKMETLEQVRAEVARMRGEVEVMAHDFGKSEADTVAMQEDAALRLQWLETRADQLEKAMGLQTPPPPIASEAPAGGESDGTDVEPATAGGGSTGKVVLGGGDTEATDDAGGITDPDALIKLAEEHLAAGREAAAEAVLNRFLDLHPKHERVPEAKYRRAEAAFNEARYAAAVLRFQEVIDGHKKSKWAPWAMLRQGECFEAQGQDANAKLFYEDVVRMWPKSQAAGEARGKLK